MERTCKRFNSTTFYFFYSHALCFCPCPFSSSPCSFSPATPFYAFHTPPSFPLPSPLPPGYDDILGFCLPALPGDHDLAAEAQLLRHLQDGKYLDIPPRQSPTPGIVSSIFLPSHHRSEGGLNASAGRDTWKFTCIKGSAAGSRKPQRSRCSLWSSSKHL